LLLVSILVEGEADKGKHLSDQKNFSMELNES